MACILRWRSNPSDSIPRKGGERACHIVMVSKDSPLAERDIRELSELGNANLFIFAGRMEKMS